MTEKEIIEDFSERFSNHGPYELARRICNRDWCASSNLTQAWKVNRTFYSVLSVIRRHRAKQHTRQLQAAL